MPSGVTESLGTGTEFLPTTPTILKDRIDSVVNHGRKLQEYQHLKKGKNLIQQKNEREL